MELIAEKVESGYGGSYVSKYVVRQDKTLRDEFAMAALQGMLAYSHVNSSHGNYHENCTEQQAAKVAYLYADAMMEARSKL